MNLVHWLHQRSNIYYGWKVIAAAAGLRTLAGGLHIYGMSIFFLPISRDLGLSRAATSLIFSLARVEGAVMAPLSGHFIDRFGARLIMGIGCLMVGVGYLLLSRAGNFLTLLLIYLVIISVGFGACFMQAPMALANNWFVRQRALVMSLVGASISLGGLVLAPFLALLVHSMGWRMGAILAGVLFLAVGSPLSRLVRNSPESLGLLPLGQTVQPATTAGSGFSSSTEKEDQDFSVRQAMRTAAFWILVMGNFFKMAAFMGVMVHFVPILIWKGIEEQTAAFYLAAFAFLGIPTSLFIGWLADRWYKPGVLSLGTALGMVGLLFLLYAGTWALFLFLPLFVTMEALHSVNAAAVGDFFGRRHFATLRGFMTTFTILGPMSGPLFAGRAYDITESYTMVLQVFIIGLVISSLAYWRLRRPLRWDRTKD